MTRLLDESSAPSSVLRPGDTCWRIETADRAAFLIDNEVYYAALHQALNGARRSIWILGWAFDPRARLAPDGREGPDDPDEIGQVLVRLTRENPRLDVRVLIWRSALSINGGHPFLQHRARACFAGSAVKYREDGATPFGACHHQKLVVIDGDLAFCGGGDMTVNRWDTMTHADGDPRRILPHRARHLPRHEVMMAVQGAAARALEDVFRDRWVRATDEGLSPAQQTPVSWPAALPMHLTQIDVATARTEPAFRARPPIAEIRRLGVACIAAAKTVIYLENQYFTSKLITEALLERLQESDGPEVVLILPGRAPSWFDRITMDHARMPLLHRLMRADRFGRFRAFFPKTASGEAIIVHSKVSVFDDQVARVGSANLNNRSEGFDTECELAIEAGDPRVRREVERLRDRLISHYLGVREDDFVRVRRQAGKLIPAIDRLNGAGRLAPITPPALGWWDRFVSRHRLGDPADAEESWRLFKDRPNGGAIDRRRIDPAQGRSGTSAPA